MSCNEFHKGKLHKLTRGMSETKNKVKELAKQYNESIVVDNFSEFVYENNIECYIYDNSNKWCGCTNDKLKEIKMFCKLNNCTYKIIKD